MSRIRPILGVAIAIAFFASPIAAITPTETPTSPTGKRAAVDLPANLHIKNVGGRDGAGLCVFTSVELAAIYQNETRFFGFQKWMTKHLGGGWPDKLDQMIRKFCAERGVEVPVYLQHTGGDDSILDLAIRTGRMPAITYAGRDDYYRGRIAHMVDLAHLDEIDAAIIDNNRPGKWVWMTRTELLSRWRDNDGGWLVVLLASPPPPSPANEKSFEQCPGGRCPIAGPKVSHEDLVALVEAGGYGVLVIGEHVTFDTPAVPYAVVKSTDFPQKKCGVYDCWRSNGVAVMKLRIEFLEPVLTPRRSEAVDQNFGIDSSKIHQGTPSYSISGVGVDRAHFMSAMLTDDSTRLHLTIVTDDDAARRAAVAAIAGLPGRERVHVQGYRSSDWPVQARGLKPGITLRRPRSAGAVEVFHSAEVSPAIAGEALTRSDPNYTPPAPPAPQNPFPLPMPGPATPTPRPLGGYLVALLLGAATVYLWRRGQTRTT